MRWQLIILLKREGLAETYNGRDEFSLCYQMEQRKRCGLWLYHFIEGITTPGCSRLLWALLLCICVKASPVNWMYLNHYYLVRTWQCVNSESSINPRAVSKNVSWTLNLRVLVVFEVNRLKISLLASQPLYTQISWRSVSREEVVFFQVNTASGHFVKVTGVLLSTWRRFESLSFLEMEGRQVLRKCGACEVKTAHL